MTSRFASGRLNYFPLAAPTTTLLWAFERAPCPIGIGLFQPITYIEILGPLN